MGINGLLRCTKSVGKKKHISDYRNKTVAVDGYSWLHKAIYKCALEVYADNNIDGVVQYFAKKISYFLKLKIKVVLVFDGDDLPLKKMTNIKRKGNRKEKMKQAKKLLQENDLENARKLLAISLDVTPDMVFTLKQNLQKKFPINVEFLVAPYEADSQLAYLSKTQYVDLVISEDSDLLVFGALEVFYKMDKYYYGVSYQQKNLKFCEEINLYNWSFDKFIQLCILSGCDYLSSPKGVGFKKAYQLMNKYNDIQKIVQVLKNDIEDSYFNNFLYAYLAFKFSRVFCPNSKKIVPLNPIDITDLKLENAFDIFAVQQAQKNLGNFDFLGCDHGQKISNEIANCEIHPKNKNNFEKIYNTQSDNPKKRSNYYKRKLDLKLKQTVSMLQLEKKTDDKIEIKQILQKKPFTQGSHMKDCVFTKQIPKIVNYSQKPESKNKNKEYQIKKDCDSKESTDYDSFLEDFLSQNRSLRIDCQNILNIFDKNAKALNQYEHKDF